MRLCDLLPQARGLLAVYKVDGVSYVSEQDETVVLVEPGATSFRAATNPAGRAGTRRLLQSPKNRGTLECFVAEARSTPRLGSLTRHQPAAARASSTNSRGLPAPNCRPGSRRQAPSGLTSPSRKRQTLAHEHVEDHVHARVGGPPETGAAFAAQLLARVDAGLISLRPPSSLRTTPPTRCAARSEPGLKPLHPTFWHPDRHTTSDQSGARY